MTCKTCTRCGVTMNAAYFGKVRGGKYLRGTCLACMRERWRLWNRAKRGGLKGYAKATTTAGSFLDVAQQTVAEAARMSPGAHGVRVYRLPSGEVRFWRGGMKAPAGAELVGVYDFEATAEDIAEDLAYEQQVAA